MSLPPRARGLQAVWRWRRHSVACHRRPGRGWEQPELGHDRHRPSHPRHTRWSVRSGMSGTGSSGTRGGCIRPYCFAHDPERADEAARARRLGGPGAPSGRPPASPGEDDRDRLRPARARLGRGDPAGPRDRRGRRPRAGSRYRPAADPHRCRGGRRQAPRDGGAGGSAPGDPGGAGRWAAPTVGGAPARRGRLIGPGASATRWPRGRHRRLVWGIRSGSGARAQIGVHPRRHAQGTVQSRAPSIALSKSPRLVHNASEVGVGHGSPSLQGLDAPPGNHAGYKPC